MVWRGLLLFVLTVVARPLTAAEIDFAREIAPIFKDHCLKCHGPEKQKGGLRLDARSHSLEPGDSGEAAILPGQAMASELIKRITSTDPDTRMPPEGERLSVEQIASLTRWIDAGAPWPESTLPTGPGEMIVTDEDRQHWAFRRLVSPLVPDVKSCEPLGEIDRFWMARLQDIGLSATNRAPPQKLVRRMYFDMVGLPPSPEDVSAFETAYAQDPLAALGTLVDRLLASHHYGERWGRHWLDVSRYADSNGQEGDQDRPFAYQYRDFVIRALNEDLPFDEFLRWQIAGDELDPDNPLAVAATGFLTAGPHTVLDVPMEEEKIRNRYNELDDMLATFGSSMLGLTLGCARCHDHKYDAIPARDYYRLLSALHSGDRREVLLGSRDEIKRYESAYAGWLEERKQAEATLDDWLSEQRVPFDAQVRREKVAALNLSDEEKATLLERPDSDVARNLAKKHKVQLAVSNDDLKLLMTDEMRAKWDELQNAVDRIRKREPKSPPKALTFRDSTNEPKPTWLFHRGDFYDKSTPVLLGFVSVLSNGKSPEEYWAEAKAAGSLESSTYQRAAVARWLTDVEYGAGPLAARVIVNRVWQHHFGEGIVRTAGDFGVQGDRPSHPELLEWLTDDFVRHGWKLKRLHRNILMSEAYLQDTTYNETSATIDPENRLLWRRRSIRLEAEILRDAMLAAAGTINLQAYGPAFKPPIPPEAMVARNLKSPYKAEHGDSPSLKRRSIYMFHKRVVPYPLLTTFDRPDALQSCNRRDATTVAPQALAMLNDDTVRQCAVEFADRLRVLSSHVDQRIEAAYSIALARPPGADEQELTISFVNSRRDERRQRGQTPEEAERAAWADLCQVLFGLNEFIYVD